MNINKDKIKLLAEQEKEIDVLIDKIKTSFKTLMLFSDKVGEHIPVKQGLRQGLLFVSVSG